MAIIKKSNIAQCNPNLPRDRYTCRLLKRELTQSKARQPMFVLEFELVGNPKVEIDGLTYDPNGIKFTRYLSLSEKAAASSIEFIESMGCTFPDEFDSEEVDEDTGKANIDFLDEAGSFFDVILSTEGRKAIGKDGQPIKTADGRDVVRGRQYNLQMVIGPVEEPEVGIGDDE